MKIRARFLAACVAVGATLPSWAFGDNFDANTYGLNVVPVGWTVTDGTVDLVGSDGVNSFFDYWPGHGLYVDLDGSSFDAGVLSHAFFLDFGVTYTASFELAGRPDGGINTVVVTFGTVSATHELGPNDPFATYTLSFTPVNSGLYDLSFADTGNDNFGAFLDNVAVVPEPATPLLLTAGLAGLLGSVLRRRR